MTDAELRRLIEIEDLVRRAQMSARLAAALLPPHNAVSGKNLVDIREELTTGIQALRDALDNLGKLREDFDEGSDVPVVDHSVVSSAMTGGPAS